MAKRNEEFVTHIASRSDDFPQWYTDVILKTDMVDYSIVKGCMVIKPYGYGVWELIQDEMDRRFKATGHVNAYFPLLIPRAFLKKKLSMSKALPRRLLGLRTAAMKSSPKGSAYVPRAKR